MRSHALPIIAAVLALDGLWHMFHVERLALRWITGERPC